MLGESYPKQEVQGELFEKEKEGETVPGVEELDDGMGDLVDRLIEEEEERKAEIERKRREEQIEDERRDDQPRYGH